MLQALISAGFFSARRSLMMRFLVPERSGPELDFRRDSRIHQRCATIGVDQLPRYPSGFFRTNQPDDIADIFRRSQASHGSPTACVPISYEILGLLRQRVQYAVLCPPGADR